jgi:hypothetical protein
MRTNDQVLDDIKTANLDDCWLKMYVYMGRAMVDEFGLEGEIALRQGIRNFGHDRGATLREEQLKLGMKINMYNLWTYYDLPGDARFKRNKIRLNTEERISQTLVCPMGSMWNNMGAGDLGAIYCDEFHPAMFTGYHPGIVTNLGQTLTHDTDDHCHFALYLRPANMTEEERKMSFAKYDPDFDENQVGEYVLRTAREGYKMLVVKLFYHLAKQTIENFGDKGRDVIARAIQSWSSETKDFMEKRAEAAGVEADATFIEENCPVNMNFSEDILWEGYSDLEINKLFEENFFADDFFKRLNASWDF